MDAGGRAAPACRRQIGNERPRQTDRGVRRIALVTLAEIIHVLSFPPGGNVCNKPLDSGLRRNDGRGNGHTFIILFAIATQQRYSCLPATGISENNLKESLIESEIPRGTGTCRPKSNNLAMTQVIDFEAR